MDKPGARLFLMGLLRQEKVGVAVIRNDVALRGNEAFQDVDLILTGRSGGLLPQDASRRAFSLRWRKAGGDWKLVAIEER
jgi:ketosteroid isomerase-like protein